MSAQGSSARRRRWTVRSGFAVAAAAMLLSAGCGSTSTNPAEDQTATSVPASVTTTTVTTTSTAVPLTKADFVAQANSICRATQEKVGQLVEDNPIGSQDLRLYVIELGPHVTGLLKEMLSQLRQLAPPAADAVQIERGWDEMKALIGRIDVDPQWWYNQIFPVDEELYDYGLTECFVTHVDVL